MEAVNTSFYTPVSKLWSNRELEYYWDIKDTEEGRFNLAEDKTGKHFYIFYIIKIIKVNINSHKISAQHVPPSNDHPIHEENIRQAQLSSLLQSA